MNKRFLVLVLTFILCLFVVGCSKSPKISLDEESITLQVGEVYEVKPTITNVEGEATVVLNADSQLISIDGCKITALKSGSATVTISLKEYPDIKVSLNVVIEKSPKIEVTGETNVYVDEEIQLEVVLTDLEGNVTWSSSDEGVATVSDGKVTGVEKGTVTITASIGEYKGELEVIVKAKPELKITGSSSVSVGNTLTLKAAGKNLEDGVTWSSSDEGVATVVNGVVTPISEGTVTITATCGNVSDTKEITVYNTRIVISGPNTVYVGEEIQLEATIENYAGTAEVVFDWSSSEDDVATVVDGKVSARQEGTIVITVTFKEFVQTYEIEISLRKEVTIEGEEQVDLGDSIELSTSLLNVSGDVTWSSSDESVATVVNGVVTGVKVGTVTISATCEGVTGTYEVSVVEVIDKVTYYYEGGSSEELYALEEKVASLTLTSYNSNSGSFWSGGYASQVYITTKGGDPKATFSDRVYIGKNEYTGYYEIKSILTSGGSSWADGAEYVITISSSYSNYRTLHAEVQKLSVGDLVMIASEDITTIKSDNTASCNFYKPEITSKKLVVEKENFDGTLIEPVKLGYEFLGWYNANDEKVEELTADEISGNVKLTAKWNELNPVTDIVINELPSEMETGDTFQIEATVSPTDAFFTQILYSTSDKDIVSITSEGLLTAVNTGTATITIQDFIGKVVKTYEITVNAIPSVDVLFDEDYTGVLAVGDTLQLEPSYLGKTVDGLTFTYASSDASVATVDSTGEVKAVANGNAEITIKTSNDKELVIGITVYGLSETEKVDQVIKLLVENNFAEVEVGNACLYNDSTTRYYKATYGSVNRYLFDDLDVIRTYESTAENNSNGHRSRRFNDEFNDSIEFVTVHDTATLTGTTQAIASNMASGGTSIHYAVGNYEVYSVVPEKYIAYHAGDGTGTPFKWNATGITATENVAPEYDIKQVNGTWYWVLNGEVSNLEAPISNGTKTISNPSKANISHLGPVWKVVDGEYYIGNTWVCFSQVAAGVIGSFGGNNNSIGIEMSVNTTNDMYDTYQRTAKLVADILIRNDLDLTRVKQHNTWTGKNCPQSLIAGNYWEDFMKMVEVEYILAKDYSDVEISIVSDNPEIVDNTGRVINAPAVATTVGYTVTVTLGTTTKTIKLYSVVPGTTSWQKWNGIYSSSLIWNSGNFVVNKEN